MSNPGMASQRKPKRRSVKSPRILSSGRIWPAEMFRSALSFELAGAFMYRQIMEKSNWHRANPRITPAPNEPHLFLLHPMIVCSAIGAETYLKTLLLAEFKTPDHHHVLLDHFKELSATTQRDISSRWKEYCDTHEHMIQQRKKTGIRKCGIRRIIWQSQDAFKEWRYPYEETREETVNPDELCKVFRASLVAMNPDFALGIDLESLSTYPTR